MRRFEQVQLYLCDISSKCNCIYATLRIRRTPRPNGAQLRELVLEDRELAGHLLLRRRQAVAHFVHHVDGLRGLRHDGGLHLPRMHSRPKQFMRHF